MLNKRNEICGYEWVSKWVLNIHAMSTPLLLTLINNFDL